MEYRTPWTRHRTLRWSEVKLLKWSQAAKWVVLEDAQGATFRISPLLGGLVTGQVAPEMMLRARPPEKR